MGDNNTTRPKRRWVSPVKELGWSSPRMILLSSCSRRTCARLRRRLVVPWEPGDVAALLVNPFYAIQIHESHSRPHKHILSESRWILSNERAIEEVGSIGWLRHLMAALRADCGQSERPDGRFAIADPYPAITVHRMLCVEHPPLIEEGLWVQANAHTLVENGEAWLRNLLSVLKGVYV